MQIDYSDCKKQNIIDYDICNQCVWKLENKKAIPVCRIDNIECEIIRDYVQKVIKKNN